MNDTTAIVIFIIACIFVIAQISVPLINDYIISKEREKAIRHGEIMYKLKESI